MTPVLVTRTAPGAEKTLARVEALGFEAIPAITAEIRPRDVVWPNGMDAIAVTSPNGARRAAELSPATNNPVYAVGDATAAVLREAGFANVISAAGDGEALAQMILDKIDDQHIVHVRGADQAFDLVAALQSRGVQATSLVAYAAEMVDALPDAALQAIGSGAVVLIHSAKGASRFLELSGGLEAVKALRAVAISADAARPLAQAGMVRIDIAAEPHEEALLATLCANPV